MTYISNNVNIKHAKVIQNLISNFEKKDLLQPNFKAEMTKRLNPLTKKGPNPNPALKPNELATKYNINVSRILNKHAPKYY